MSDMPTDELFTDELYLNDIGVLQYGKMPTAKAIPGRRA
jgi:hypothetical protein